MASGSGIDQDFQEPAHGNGQGQREDSNAATPPSDAVPSAAAAQGGADADASSPSPLPAAPVGRPRERLHEQAGGGSRGGAHGSSSAAVGVVDLKGKRPADIPSSPVPSAPRSAGSSPSNPFPGGALPFEAGTSSSAPVDYNELFQQLLRDAKAEAATPSSAPVECQELLAQLVRDAREEEEEKKKPEEEQVKSLQPNKNLSTRKNEIVDTEGRQIYQEHVVRKTIPITKVAKHYDVTGDMPIRVNLDAYSKVRPVLGDGECFYRSFIFSYLEQVLDRQDTHEEQRLLDTIERVSTEHTNLGWTSEFCRSCIEFTKLIMKVMEWKRHGRQNNIASTNSYRKEKLLEFFSTYDTTNDIFVFLRLLVAIQICSHSQYQELITDRSENCSLKDWCFKHVTPSREFTDYVMMLALATALEVPLRVERLYEIVSSEHNTIYTGPGVVSLTLLYTGNHYDIIYPGAPSSEEGGVERGGNKRPQGYRGDYGEWEGDEGGKTRGGKRLRRYRGYPVEEGDMELHNLLPAKLVTKDPETIRCQTELQLHRRHQGLGSILQQIGCVPIFESRQDIEERVRINAKKTDPVLQRTIQDLPVAIIQEILMRFHGQDFRQIVASSFIFLRAAVGPCHCDAFREVNNFIGAIIQPRHGCSSVGIPERIRFHPLQSVGQMLQKFITLSNKARRWYKVIDSRGGYLLVSRDSRANRLGIVKPLETVHIDKLPLVPFDGQEKFICASVLPVDRPRYEVIMMCSVERRIILRSFSSHSGVWTRRNIECRLVLSALPESSHCPLFASNKIHLLDRPRMRLLRLSLEHNTLDAIALPVSAKQMPLHHDVLSRTREGEICWVTLDNGDINVFIFDGITWKRKWRWPVPNHFYSCHLMGFAEGSPQVMLECSGEICCINVQEGTRTYLKDNIGSGSCLSFEADHFVLDHE